MRRAPGPPLMHPFRRLHWCRFEELVLQACHERGIGRGGRRPEKDGGAVAQTGAGSECQPAVQRRAHFVALPVQRGEVAEIAGSAVKFHRGLETRGEQPFHARRIGEIRSRRCIGAVLTLPE